MPRPHLDILEVNLEATRFEHRGPFNGKLHRGIEAVRNITHIAQTRLRLDPGIPV